MKRLIILGVVLSACAALLVFGGYTWIKGNDTQEPAIKTEYEKMRSAFQRSIEEVGGQEAYASFLETVDQSPIDTHTQAHIFGEALYNVEGLEGVSVCDTSLRFGCYHSFFGQAIFEKGIEILPELNLLCRSNYGEDTKCQHGLGHGLLVYTGYEELLPALELCESIDAEQTGGCLGGVFMEYNFHTMDQVDGGLFLRPLKDDPYEPCNTLPERFHPACYLEQVQWWETVYAADFVYIGTLCEPLSKESGAYASCHRGVGNHYAEVSLFDFDKIEAVCSSLATDEATQYCREGVTWLIVGREEHKDLYMSFCALLTGTAQETCYARWDTVVVF